MDGTLTVPLLDFGLIRKEAGLPPAGDIVSALNSMPDENKRKAWKVIERHEAAASVEMRLQDGVVESLVILRKKDVRLGLLTRNSRRSVQSFMEVTGIQFDQVITREYPFMKPRPEPVIHMLEKWKLNPDEALVVGDYIHDIECGRAAGTRTCFFANPGSTSYAEFADYSVSSFSELMNLL
ncbi:MAG: hypothetical protein A2X45_22525 [Lentisphaerae bacterium GWF2_50_93]|nr:MAG: hypothetical protein A2X45_22525 [Lentisphaerae bacterium GWF2_50_93]